MMGRLHFVHRIDRRDALMGLVGSDPLSHPGIEGMSVLAFLIIVFKCSERYR